MAGTQPTGTTGDEVMAGSAALEDPKIREVNEKHGNDHGVSPSRLRALAKRCTSPFAPTWITELVRRQNASS